MSKPLDCNPAAVLAEIALDPASSEASRARCRIELKKYFDPRLLDRTLDALAPLVESSHLAALLGKVAIDFVIDPHGTHRALKAFLQKVKTARPQLKIGNN